MNVITIDNLLRERGIDILEDLPVDNSGNHYTIINKIINSLYGYEVNRVPLIAHSNLLNFYDYIFPYY